MAFWNKTNIIAGAAVASLGVVAVAGMGVASAHHSVTVSADGNVKALTGFYPDVQSVLNAADIELGPADQVEPALGRKVSNYEVIEVRRAQPYRVVSAGAPSEEWSSAVSLDAVFDDVASTPGDTIVVSRANVRTELPLVHDARTVTVNVDSTPAPVEVAGGETVAEILEAAKFVPSPLDEVRVERQDGEPVLSVTTEKREISTKTEPVPFTEERVDDPEIEKGTETVAQEGADGERTVKTYQQVRAGKTIVAGELSNEVTKEPVKQIVHVGTKEPEEPGTTDAPDAGGETSESGSPAVAPDGAVTSGDVWAALAQCESGGNPSTNTGNGFYGMYQFSLPTWNAVGGTGLPSDASAAEQTTRAQILQAQAGWGQWPACSASLGLY